MLGFAIVHDAILVYLFATCGYQSAIDIDSKSEPAPKVRAEGVVVATLENDEFQYHGVTFGFS